MYHSFILLSSFPPCVRLQCLAWFCVFGLHVSGIEGRKRLWWGCSDPNSQRVVAC